MGDVVVVVGALSREEVVVVGCKGVRTAGALERRRETGSDGVTAAGGAEKREAGPVVGRESGALGTM